MVYIFKRQKNKVQLYLAQVSLVKILNPLYSCIWVRGEANDPYNTAPCIPHHQNNARQGFSVICLLKLHKSLPIIFCEHSCCCVVNNNIVTYCPASRNLSHLGFTWIWNIDIFLWTMEKRKAIISYFMFAHSWWLLVFRYSLTTTEEEWENERGGILAVPWHPSIWSIWLDLVTHQLRRTINQNKDLRSKT